MTTQPCSILPQNAFSLRHERGIAVSIQHFSVKTAKLASTAIAKHGYSLPVDASRSEPLTYISYHAYAGPLDPPPHMGRPGDTYVNTKLCAAYARTLTGWTEWRGPAPTERTWAVKLGKTGGEEFKKGLMAHPEVPELRVCLWCDGERVGWFGTKTVSKMRRQVMSRLIHRPKTVGVEGGRAVVREMLDAQLGLGSKRNREDGIVHDASKRSRAVYGLSLDFNMDMSDS